MVSFYCCHERNIFNFIYYKNDLNYWSNKVSILYTDNEKKIDQILSFKNSKLVKGNQTIISDNIAYKLIDQKIFAKGHIILTQDEDTMMGDELSIDLADSTSIMKGTNQNKVKVKIKRNNDIK